MCPDETAANHVSWKASLNNWWRKPRERSVVWRLGGSYRPLAFWTLAVLLQAGQPGYQERTRWWEEPSRNSSLSHPQWSEEAKAAHTTSAQHSTPGDTTSSTLLSWDAVIQSQMGERGWRDGWAAQGACASREDRSLVPSTYIRWWQIPVTPAPGDPPPSFSLLRQHPSAPGHTHTKLIHTDINVNYYKLHTVSTSMTGADPPWKPEYKAGYLQKSVCSLQQ